jgi:hypothetical protein
MNRSLMALSKVQPVGIALMLVAACGIAGLSAARADQFVAEFSDGERISGTELRNWHDVGSQPTLNGRGLLQADRHVEWVVNTTVKPVSNLPALVEFAGDDCLPGEVIGYSAEADQASEATAPCLIISPAVNCAHPDGRFPNSVRVFADDVRRVVWDSRGDRATPPGTAVLRTGAIISFRAARWGDGTLTLLQTGGVKEFPWTEIAEISFPEKDPWEGYVQRLARLAPGRTGRLVRLTSSKGARFTSTADTFVARHFGDANKLEECWHWLHPIWSVDPLFSRVSEIQCWEFPKPEVMRLNLSDASRVENRPVLAAGWPPRSNQSVEGLPLEVGDKLYPFGIGVMGTTEITFATPAWAERMRTGVGLVTNHGPGGFGHARVVAIPSSKETLGEVGSGGETELFQVNGLCASKTSAQSSWFDLPEGQSQISLQTEMGHADRPADADPYDIRDTFCWLAPEVQLSAEKLHAKAKGALTTSLPQLQGWKIAPSDAARMTTQAIVDRTRWNDERRRVLLGTTDRFLTMTRTIRRAPGEKWIAVNAFRCGPDLKEPMHACVTVNRWPLLYSEVSVREGSYYPDPLMAFVPEELGENLTVELSFIPTKETASLDFRGVTLSVDRPGLLVIPLEAGGDRITKLPRQVAIRQEPMLSQYAYVDYEWQGEAGSWMKLEFADHGQFVADLTKDAQAMTKRYRQGNRNQAGPREERGWRNSYSYIEGRHTSSSIVLGQNIGTEKHRVERNLFDDFGPFEISAIRFSAGDEGGSKISRLILARHPQMFHWLREQQKPREPLEAGRLVHEREHSLGGQYSAPIIEPFASSATWFGVVIGKEHFGEERVLQTHPNEQNQPVRLVHCAKLPVGQRTELEIVCSHLPGHNWPLKVLANGESLLEVLIPTEAPADQQTAVWETHRVDLSRFAGQNVVLVVENGSNDWNYEVAVWKSLRLRAGN